jgi:hypothetical protein
VAVEQCNEPDEVHADGPRPSQVIAVFYGPGARERCQRSMIELAILIATMQEPRPERVYVTPSRSQVVAVFRGELRRLEGYPKEPGVCLGMSNGTGYLDPDPQVVKDLSKRFPSIAAASRCPPSGHRVIVVGPFFREGGRLLAQGGEWSIVGRCTYTLARRLLGGWSAKQQPCPLE